jgi:hypothetical protein
VLIFNATWTWTCIESGTTEKQISLSWCQKCSEVDSFKFPNELIEQGFKTFRATQKIFWLRLLAVLDWVYLALTWKLFCLFSSHIYWWVFSNANYKLLWKYMNRRLLSSRKGKQKDEEWHIDGRVPSSITIFSLTTWITVETVIRGICSLDAHHVNGFPSKLQSNKGNSPHGTASQFTFPNALRVFGNDGCDSSALCLLANV